MTRFYGRREDLANVEEMKDLYASMEEEGWLL